MLFFSLVVFAFGWFFFSCCISKYNLRPKEELETHESMVDLYNEKHEIIRGIAQKQILCTSDFPSFRWLGGL